MTPTSVVTAVSHWNALLDGVDGPQLCGALAAEMRSRRLRFGDRVLCPFLRPFFLEPADEARVKSVVEVLWRLGERVARAAIETRCSRILH
jgi:hypothetical protein